MIQYEYRFETIETLDPRGLAAKVEAYLNVLGVQGYRLYQIERSSQLRSFTGAEQRVYFANLILERQLHEPFANPLQRLSEPLERNTAVALDPNGEISYEDLAD
jgi:hypothetical protein